jgi:tetratricopeptide (TPR) repeat protein
MIVVKKSAVAVFLLISIGAVLAVHAQQGMNYHQARRIVIKTIHDRWQQTEAPAQVSTGSVTFYADGSGYYLPNGQYTLDLRTLGRVTVTEHVTPRGTHYYFPLFNGMDPDERGRNNPAAKPDHSWPNAINLLAWTMWHPAHDPQALSKAQSFADALNYLAAVARGEISGGSADEWRDFQQKAAAWRGLATKPPLDSEADRHWILAENAVKEKNLDSAEQHYEAALEIQPAWPTGWFDLAMIYAEQKNFADAADAMKHYLELTPDAPDARDARTQMIIWEDKAKQQ